MKGYELTDFEWGVIAPLLPNKPRGVPRVDDRRVLNGIFWVLRTGAPWRALPKEEFGPYTTCYNRFVRWRKAGGWDRVMAAGSKAYDADWLRRQIEAAGAAPNIPPMVHRRWKPCFRPVLYRAHNRIERFFNRIKHFRRLATRYEKHAANFLAMLKLAATHLWLRHNESVT